MINIHRLGISFSGEDLFQGLTFNLKAGDKIGFVGKNGAGKTTLLKILSGELEPSSGKIAYEKDIKIGYLKQDIDFEKGRTILEEAQQAFVQIKSVEKQIDKTNHALAERTDYKSASYNQLMIDVNELQHQYELLGGYNYQGESERVLKGLGFTEKDFSKQTSTFSGGWRMRVELAKLLLQNNDVLLLDEPTNHLDIESIIWLESFLNNHPGCVLIVSHDKMFLDNITNRTIEISLGQIYDHNKPYSQYLIWRKEQRQQKLAAHKNQQKEIKQTEKLIDRFRAKASKATMAQSLIKKLDKMERIEVDEEDNAVMNVRFPVSINPGKVVVKLEDISKTYGTNKVLNNINIQIDRHSKTAFVGQNGQGKTTLAKIIVGEIDCEGKKTLGHNVQLGYFAQNQADYLEGTKTVLQTMEEDANEKTRTKVRDILGAFLFRGDDVEKQVKVLSGGERNRLALAKMLLQPFNVLVMDEPTNHLDIQSKNVLKQALKNFEGTLILISHDRDFLQGLNSIVYEFKDHKLNQYLGDIDYYLERRKLENLRQAETKTPIKKVEKPANNKGKQSYKQQKKLKSLKNKISKVEAKISKLEKKIEEKDYALAMDYDKTASDPEFFEAYQADKTQLDKLMQRWEHFQEKYDHKS